MPIPQVNDRIKEAPVVVLRAVFAGIGQILLTADKVRARAAEQVWTPDRAQERAPAPPRNGATWTESAVAGHSAVREAQATHGPVTTKTTSTAKATSAAKTRPAAKSGPATKASPMAKTAPAAKAGPTAKTTPDTKAPRAAKAAKSVPAPRAAEAEPAPQAPPLPGYDDLSIASLRARLRVLDAPAIEAMLAYEKEHARREPVITMLERRLAKISAG